MTTDPTVTALGSTQHRVQLPSIGEHVGRYAIVGEIGAGAMGAVFLASDTQLERRIALKVLTRGAQDGKLLDEARALAKLQHPNVVAIHDVGRWGERVYLAMEYIDGGSLTTWLETHPGWRERLDAFVQAARGLAAAHRAGLVHHDVKPSNIVVGSDGRVRLVDFGLARSTPEHGAGSPGGTPRYMSPEQRKGLAADARTDQFSLCVALYEALFDDHPFAGDTHDQRNAAAIAGIVTIPRGTQVPVPIVQAIVKGLSGDPDLRHPSLDALVDALVEQPPTRRGLWIAGAVGLAAAAVGVTAAIVSSSSSGSSSSGDPPVSATPDPRAEILAASHLPDELRTPLPSDPFGMTVHRLKNGLTVYISPNHERPHINAEWRFRGGNLDAPGIANLAGLYLSTQGTETTGTLDYAAEKPHLDQIRALYHQRKTAKGDELARIDKLIDLHTTLASAYQIPDDHNKIQLAFGAARQRSSVSGHEIRFTTDLPSNRLSAWIDLEADRWLHRVTRRFRQTTRQSIAQFANDNATLEARVNDAVGLVQYAGTNDSRPMSTTVDAMLTEPFEEAESYGREHFVPNNAELILVGDIDPITAIPLLEKAFATWAPRAIPPPDPTPSFTPVAKTITVPSTGERALSFRWITKGVGADDLTTIDAITFLAARLRKSKLGSMPGEIAPDPVRPGVEYRITAYPGPTGSLESAAALIDATVDLLRRGAFTDEELQSTILMLKFDRVYRAADDDERIRAFNGVAMGLMSWAHRTKVFDRASTLTRAEIMRVANLMFAGAHLSVRIEPGEVKIARPETPASPYEIPTTGRSPGALALLARPHAPVQPKFLLRGRDYEAKQTTNGYLLAAPNASKVAELTVRWEIGDGELHHLCAAINARSVAPDVVEQQFRYAVRFSAECSSNSVIIRTVGPDDQLTHAVEMLDMLLSDPTLAEWTQMKSNSLHNLTFFANNLTYVQTLAYHYAAYGPSEPYLELYDAALLKQSTLADGIRALHGLRRSDRAYAYVGARSLDEVATLLHPKLPGPTVRALPPAKLLKTPRVVLLDHKGVGTVLHSHLIWTFDATDRRPLFDLLQQYWLPQTHPFAIPGTGVVTYNVPNVKRDRTTAIEVRVDAPAKDTVKAIEGTITELTQHVYEPAAVKRSKVEIDEKIRAEWLDSSEVAVHLLRWHALGIDGDPRQSEASVRDHLTGDDLARLGQQLRSRPRVILVWGDLTGVDPAKFSKLGPVTKVTYAGAIAEAAALHRKRR